MALAIDAIPPATSSSAPWIGRNANPTPLCSSRTAGFDENAMSTRVTARSTVKAMLRRRAVRVARRELIGRSWSVMIGGHDAARRQRGGRA
jgi:hypothetical protein